MADDEEELDAIRRKKIEELQQRQQQQMMAEEQGAEIKAQRQAVLRRILAPEARERLGRLTLAYPDIAESVENQLIVLSQSGRIKSVIDDRTLVEILARIVPKKRDIKIERR
jgi:programmed cell death protein 5